MKKYIFLIITLLLCIIVSLLCVKRESFDNMTKYCTKIINLEIDKERLNKMTAQLENLSIDYNVFKAVNGNDYTIDSNDKFLFQNVDFDIYKKKGVVGCFLSHIKCLEQFIKQDDKQYMVVCEDDIDIIEPKIHDYLQYIIDNIDFSIIFLSAATDVNDSDEIMRLDDKYTLRRAYQNDKMYSQNDKMYSQGAQMYIITKSCASEFLDCFYSGKSQGAVDWELLKRTRNPMVVCPSFTKYSTPEMNDSTINKMGGH